MICLACMGERKPLHEFLAVPWLMVLPPAANTGASVIGALAGTNVWQTDIWLVCARDSLVRLYWRLACTLMMIDTCFLFYPRASLAVDLACTNTVHGAHF